MAPLASFDSSEMSASAPLMSALTLLSARLACPSARQCARHQLDRVGIDIAIGIALQRGADLRALGEHAARRRRQRRRQRIGIEVEVDGAVGQRYAAVEAAVQRIACHRAAVDGDGIGSRGVGDLGRDLVRRSAARWLDCRARSCPPTPCRRSVRPGSLTSNASECSASAMPFDLGQVGGGRRQVRRNIQAGLRALARRLYRQRLHLELDRALGAAERQRQARTGSRSGRARNRWRRSD